MNEQRLTEIESKVAYQEDMLQQLSDVIYQQQQQIDKLEIINQRIIQRLQDIQRNSGEQASSQHEKPPHY